MFSPGTRSPGPDTEEKAPIDPFQITSCVVPISEAIFFIRDGTPAYFWGKLYSNIVVRKKFKVYDIEEGRQHLRSR